jgi:hypothetical protein
LGIYNLLPFKRYPMEGVKDGKSPIDNSYKDSEEETTFYLGKSSYKLKMSGMNHEKKFCCLLQPVGSFICNLI